MTSTLTADWLPGITRDDVQAAILGGACPTEGMDSYTIHPDARIIRMVGTPEGVDAVWDFLATNNIVAPWPNFLDSEALA